MGPQMSPSGPGPLTYAGAGVDRGAVATALSNLLRSVRYHPPSTRGRPVAAPGHYAGLLRLGRETLALTTDGVGTKLVLAQQLDRWEEMGEDVVAVNVNDLLSVGAFPAAFLDYIACRNPQPRVFAALGRGIDRGLRLSQCHLAGGETAVVPDLVHFLDLSGTALGFYPDGHRPVTGRDIRVGDTLIGLPSSGFHANGYTLVRRLLETSGISLAERISGERLPLGRLLLTPTRIYAPPVEALIRKRLTVGLAHISGGGFRNLVRLHPRVEFCLDAMPPPQGVFQWVAALSELPPGELYQTFNMGIGFVVVVRSRRESQALEVLADHGEAKARVIGQVKRGRGVTIPHEGIRYQSY
jgi:phosphoribosylformylglycinamidine cyclo-ligase